MTVSRNMYKSLIAAFAAVGAAGPLMAGTTPVSTTIALEGDTPPDGGGTFCGFFNPALNDSGELAFRAVVDTGSTTEDAIYFADASGTLTMIAREGDITPDGGGTFSNLTSPAINVSGELAFRAVVTDEGPLEEAIYFADSNGTLTSIARVGNTPPDGDGTFSSLNFPFFNDSGELAFRAVVDTGSTTEDAIYFADKNGTLTEIVREGDTPPDGNGTFSGMLPSGFNDSGELTIRAIVDTGITFEDAIYFADSGGTLTKIARQGDRPQDGGGTFIVLVFPTINNSGMQSFLGVVDIGSSTEETIYVSDSSGTLTEIVREGDTPPDGGGTFCVLNTSVINGGGELAFLALVDTDSNNETAIYFADSNGMLSKIAREGDIPPDAGGTFSEFNTPAINGSGELAFQADVVTGSTTEQAIYFSDSDGMLTEIAREGDNFEVAPGDIRTISAVSIVANSGGEDGQRTSLNDSGQLVGQISFEDAISGVFRFALFCPGECLGDINGNGEVDGSDLALLLGAFGPCPDEELCCENLNGDDQVDDADLGFLLAAWGPCEEMPGGDQSKDGIPVGESEPINHDQHIDHRDVATFERINQLPDALSRAIRRSGEQER